MACENSPENCIACKYSYENPFVNVNNNCSCLKGSTITGGNC